MSTRKLFILLLWLGCLGNFSAQPQTFSSHKVFGKYQQFVWREQQGLPQNTVQAITRTRDGYLWLGTLAGAARFDGMHFSVFDNGNTDAIKGSYITALLEDRQGTLWLTSDSGGLVSYRDGRFSQYTTQDGLPGDTTKSLLEDREGNLWIGGEGGLTKLKEGQFTVYTTREGLPPSQVSSLLEDPDGSLWIGTEDGLARFKDGRFTVYTTRDGLAYNHVRSLCRDASDTLWIGTNNGLSRFQNHRLSSTGLPDPLTHVSIPALYYDREGYLWIGTLGNGLFRCKDGRFERYTTKEGLPGDRIVAIYQEPEGDIWVGTDGGLCQLRAGLFQTYTVQDGLQPDFISTIYEDLAGSLWLGTTNGLNRFKDGQFTAYTAKDGMPAKYIRSMCEDRTGALWIGTQGGGLTRFADGRFTTWTTKDGLANDLILALYADNEGNLWVGTNDGLQRFREGRFTRYTTADGLADNTIKNLFADQAGNLWIGTQSGGLSRLKDGQLTTWTARDGLTGKPIASFFEDREGNLWIGTLDGGLSRFKDGKFANIGAKDGLYDNVAFQILADADDDNANLWMSCNKGIYRVKLKELNEFADGRRPSVTSFVYGNSDGMLSRECNSASPGGWRTRNGLLWFPTTKGLVKIDLKNLNRQPPLLAIERVIVDRLPLPVNQMVQIRPEQENLEIAYTGLSWSRPQQIRFKYQLVGLDRDWVEAGTRRTAYYPHLPPGDYTFKVIADNGEGVWNLEGASLRVIVLPPFYRTWWFTLLAALAVVSLGTLMYQIRVRRLTRAKAAQEAFSRQLINSQEQERKRIAAELHDSLGQSLVVIKNLAMMMLYPSDQETMRQQVQEISSETSRAISEVKEISYNLRPFHLDQFGLTRSIESMIDNVAKACDTKFSADLDHIDGLLAQDEEINLYRIVQESLNNIVKHSGASEASVVIRHGEQDLTMTIKDNGKGFTPAVTVSPTQKSGFGLTGIGERTRLLGGEARIHGEPGQGTTVWIKIPLKGKLHE
jgi:ligand-binding sensor domain-containing protein/signal transduction histidine kinase